MQETNSTMDRTTNDQNCDKVDASNEDGSGEHPSRGGAVGADRDTKPADVTNTGDEIPLKDCTLESSSTERILEVARWSGSNETRDWNRRVGIAMEAAGKIEEAIKWHRRATELDLYHPQAYFDMSKAWFHSGMGKSDTEYLSTLRMSLEPMEKGVELARQLMGSPDVDRMEKLFVKADYLNALFRLAIMYGEIKEVDQCLAMCKELLKDWEGVSLAAIDSYVNYYASCCVEQLDELEQYEALESVLDRVVNHPRLERNFYSFYSHLLEAGVISVGDRLLKFAYVKDRFNLVDRFWRSGMKHIAREGHSGQMAVLRWHRANLLIRLAPGMDAFPILERIAQDHEIATPTNAYHWLKDKAELELARCYLNKALDARERDRWNEVGAHAHDLSLLVDREGNDGASSASLILAAWNRLSGRPGRAKQCVRAYVEQALDMLYDADEENDEWAWSKICDALLVVGDERRAVAAVGMYSSLRHFGNTMGLVSFKTTSADEGKKRQDAQTDIEETRAVARKEPEKRSSDEIHGLNDDISGHVCEANGAQQTPATLLPAEERGSNLPLSQINTDPQGAVHNPEHLNGHRGEESGLSVAGVDTVGRPVNEASSEVKAKPGSCDSGKQHAADTDVYKVPYTCDGPCFGNTSSWFKRIYRCSYCIADLCETCHNLVKDGKNVSFAVCGKTHEAFEIQPVEKYPAKMMKVGREFVLVEVWLDALADEWGIKRRGKTEWSGENQP